MPFSSISMACSVTRKHAGTAMTNESESFRIAVLRGELPLIAPYYLEISWRRAPWPTCSSGVDIVGRRIFCRQCTLKWPPCHGIKWYAIPFMSSKLMGAHNCFTSHRPTVSKTNPEISSSKVLPYIDISASGQVRKETSVTAAPRGYDATLSLKTRARVHRCNPTRTLCNAKGLFRVSRPR